MSITNSFVKFGALSIVCGSVVGLSLGTIIPIGANMVKKSFENITASVNTDVSTDEAAVSTEDYSSSAIATMDEGSKNTVEIIKNIKPSVACITSVVEGTDFFYQTYETTDSGSGIVFYKDATNAYIATNSTVISGASRVSVSINECDLVSASLVGKDTTNDLAVISVKLSDLAAAGVTDIQTAEFGDSADLSVGETVIAIGNALGQGNTATKGIISATSREITYGQSKITVLQTDAAINPGNDGGALVNSSGKVIGINTTKVSNTQVEGVGYAIPSSVAKPIIEELMNTTKTPALGVTVATVSADVAKQYGIPSAGVLIQQVSSGGSAEAGGIQKGDVITSFNGSPTLTANDLVDLVKKAKVGDTVTVKLYRNGSEKTLSIKLQESSGF